jgi:hypothetical protein
LTHQTESNKREPKPTEPKQVKQKKQTETIKHKNQLGERENQSSRQRSNQLEMNQTKSN